ncbi:MAG: class I SAM-dependent methyltransferase [Methanoregulaceae archaeon]
MTEFFEQAAVIWDSDPGRVKMAGRIADAMIQALALKGRVTMMDYGTGTGLIALRMLPYAEKIVAVDSAKSMLEVLQGKLDEMQVRQIEPRQWGIGDPAGNFPPFDIIVSSMTLHHVKNTAAAAREFYGLLAEGGRIAIADLDLDNGEFHEKPGIAEHDGFSRDALATLFEQTGFRDVRFQEATSIRKISSRTGKLREFTIFLLTASKDQGKTTG